MITHLNNKLLFIEENPTTKDEMITKLIDLVDSETKKIGCRTAFLEKIYERETIGGTSIGKGILLPHARCEKLEDVVIAIGIAKIPFEFKSIDGEKGKIVVLIGAPKEKQKQYLQMLSEITRMLRDADVRDSLKSANSIEEIIEVVLGYHG